MSTPLQLRRLLVAFVATLALASSLVIAAVAAPSGADVSDGWTVIDVGRHHTCGVTTVGEAYCWGSSTEGALGDGNSDLPGRSRIPALVPAPPGVTWATIDVGEYHSCGLSTDGDLFCWGNDNLDVGTLGNGPVVDGQFRYPDPTPVTTPAGVTWASISAGAHSCALSTDGDAYCWGLGQRGQIGDGASVDRDVPTLVTAPAGVTWAEVHAGASDTNNFGSKTTCAISTTGAGYCWGADTHGQLGDGVDLVDADVPVEVVTPPGRTWTSLRPGMNHTCGVTDTGDGYCWGRGEAGRLGSGENAGPNGEPVLVDAPTGVLWTQIVPGGFYTCGITTTGAMYCWGSEGGNGSMGNGGPEVAGIETTPVPVSTPAEVDGWASVSAGYQHTCAVDVDGVGWCWGRDVEGVLGNGGTDTNEHVPAMVLAAEPTGGPQTIEQFFLNGTYPFGTDPFQIRAIAASPLAIVFTSETPTVCTTSDGIMLNGYTNSTLTIVGVGTCTVTATQPGDADWDAAEPVTRSITVTGAVAPITLSGLAQTHDGDPKPAIVTTDPAGLGTTVTYDGSPTPPTDAGSYAVVATIDEPGYEPSQTTGTLVIARGQQFIFFTTLVDIAFGDPPVPLVAWTSSGLPVSFSVAGPCTLDGTTVTATNAGSCTVRATQAGDDNWLTATPIEQTFGIAGAASTVNVTGWDATYDGAPHGVEVTTDPAGIATTTTYDGSPTPPTDAGSYAVVITVTESGFDPEQVTGTLTIAKAAQTIAVEPFRLQVFGDGGIDLIATATSGLPVGFAAAGVCTMTGNHVNQTGAGDCFVTMSQPGDDNWLAAPDVVRNAEITQAGSTTALSLPADDSAVGTGATFTATVTGVGTPTGTVTFTADTGATDTVALVDGVATWTTDDLPLGESTITADFSGDADHRPSSIGPAAHLVVTATLTVTGLPDEVEAGDDVDIDATGFHPGEVVEFVFESDPVDVGTATADATGAVALSFAIPDVGAGAHTLRATGSDSALEVTAGTTIVEDVAPPTTAPPSTDPTPTTVPTDTGTPTTVAAALNRRSVQGTATSPGVQNTGGLAATGAGSAQPLAATGAVLLLAGIVLLSRSRRRLG